MGEDYSDDIAALEAEVWFLTGMAESYLLETQHYRDVLGDTESTLYELARVRHIVYDKKRQRVQEYLEYLKSL